MRTLLLLFSAALLFPACSSVPDHARYVPADATVVVGVNFKSLAKDIAWSKIVGSDILDELEKKAAERGGTSTAVRDLEKAGLQLMSTAYVYAKSTEATGMRAVAVIPLKDRNQWAAYVKKTFPQATVRTVEKRSECRLAEALYAGWDDDVLLLMNTDKKPSYTSSAMAINDTSFSTPMSDPADDSHMDDVALGAQMQLAFGLKKDASILGNKRFKTLEGEGHDVTVFVNYENMMNGMMGTGEGAVMGMYANLYKGTAMTAGFDFEKGRIAGAARYYTPEAMEGVYKKMGKENVDDDLLDRVPAQNLNALFAWNISPGSVQGMLEKMNLLGMANLALGGQGFSVEDITEAFAGDMLVAMNDFRMKTVQDTFPTTTGYGDEGMAGGSAMMPMETYSREEPDFNYLFAMKMGKKEKFDKILAWAVREGALRQTTPGTYAVGDFTGDGGSVLMVEKDLVVLARNAAAARAYLDGKGKGKIPEVAREAVYGHPMGLYFDVQTVLANMGAGAFSGARDSLTAAEVRRTFTNAGMHSTGFKSGAFHYEMEFNMTNKTENSLVQLIDFAARMRVIDQQYEELEPPVVEAMPVPFDSDTTALVEPITEDAR